MRANAWNNSRLADARSAVEPARGPERPPLGAPDTIRLSVLDAETGAPIPDARVRRVDVAAVHPEHRDAHRAALGDGSWVFTPELGDLPGSHVLRLPFVARGPSPLEVPARAQSQLWIDAPGRGWARITLHSAWPADVTVRLRAAATVDVVVNGAQDYARVFVTISARRAEGSLRSGVKRPATNGRASFDGLGDGTYRVRADGLLQGGQVDVAETELVLSAGERRAVVLDLVTTWGSLGVRLRDPSGTTDDAAPLDVRYVPMRDDRRGAERLVLERDAGVLAPSVHRTAEPIHVPAGDGELVIAPHGVRVPVRVHPGPTTWIDADLPELARRTIRFHDVTRDAAWTGHFTVLRWDEDESRRDFEPLMQLFAGRDGGRTTARWPATRFLIALPSDVRWVDPGQAYWANGAAMPDELVVQVMAVGVDDLRPLEPDEGTVVRQVRPDGSVSSDGKGDRR